jgi:hypothetical protein
VNVTDNNIAVLSQNFEQSSFARCADDPLPSYDLLGVVPDFHSFTASPLVFSAAPLEDLSER